MIDTRGASKSTSIKFFALIGEKCQGQKEVDALALLSPAIQHYSTMLARLGWRLLQATEFLWVFLSKAHMFFMETQPRLYVVKPTKYSDISWTIGDGQTVHMA